MTEPQLDTQGEAREALNSTVADFGQPVLSDARMMRSHLSDLLPDLPRERHLLVIAAEADVAGQLTQQVQGRRLDPETAIQMVSRSFSERTSIDLASSIWVTTEYARGSGLSRAVGRPALATATATSGRNRRPRFLLGLFSAAGARGRPACTVHLRHQPEMAGMPRRPRDRPPHRPRYRPPHRPRDGPRDRPWARLPPLQRRHRDHRPLGCSRLPLPRSRKRNRWPVFALAGVAVLGLIAGLVVWAPWHKVPIAPEAIVGQSPTATSVLVSWSPSSGGAAIDHYLILRDGTQVARRRPAGPRTWTTA